jgi:predicted nucleotidyltransferase
MRQRTLSLPVEQLAGTEEIAAIVEKIRREYHPEKIVLFGSYACGMPGKDSDVDLLIVKETKERPIDRRLAVARIISDSRRTIPVDAIVLTPGEIESRLEIGDQFIEEITRHGSVLYAA